MASALADLMRAGGFTVETLSGAANVKIGAILADLRGEKALSQANSIRVARALGVHFSALVYVPAADLDDDPGFRKLREGLMALQVDERSKMIVVFNHQIGLEMARKVMERR